MLAVHDAADLFDHQLDAVEHLTGAGAAAMIAAAFDELGVRLDAVRVAEVHHAPAHSCTVTYDVQLSWPDGSQHHETFVATSRVDGPPPGAAVLQAGAMTVGAWRYPFDPCLPGLADLVLPGRSTEVVHDAVGHTVAARVVSYRAGRRAVVHVEGTRGSCFAKVVAPARLERFLAVHDGLLAAGVPVPRRLGADPRRGIAVTAPLPGTTAREVLERRGRAKVRPELHPALIEELAVSLGRFERAELGGRPARRDPLRDLAAHHQTLARIEPAWCAWLDDLVAAVERGDRDPARRVVVHGDLHDGQIVVDRRGHLVGLLDLDDVGLADPADDVANLWGHLRVLGTQRDADHDGIGRVLRELPDLVRRRDLDPDRVAGRAAAVVIGLATGPFRARSPHWRSETTRRLAVASDLLAGAGARV